MRGTGTVPAQPPGDTAPPTMAMSHARGAGRGAMERGQWDHNKMMTRGQVGSKHPHYNSTNRMGMGDGDRDDWDEDEDGNSDDDDDGDGTGTTTTTMGMTTMGT